MPKFIKPQKKFYFFEVPITSGGTPATEYDTNLAIIGRFKISAADRRANKTTAAPSVNL